MDEESVRRLPTREFARSDPSNYCANEDRAGRPRTRHENSQGVKPWNHFATRIERRVEAKTREFARYEPWNRFATRIEQEVENKTREFARCEPWNRFATRIEQEVENKTREFARCDPWNRFAARIEGGREQDTRIRKV